MCMRNVNITTFFCKDLQYNANGEIIGFSGIFKSITAENIGDNQFILPKLNIVMQMCLVKERDSKAYNIKDSEENVIDFNKTYTIALHLVKISSGKYLELTQFDFCPNNSNPKHFCRTIIDKTTTYIIDKIKLQEGIGEYAIKVMIRESIEGSPPEENPWCLQSINPLLISEI